jgi:hypothetical protein
VVNSSVYQLCTKFVSRRISIINVFQVNRVTHTIIFVVLSLIHSQTQDDTTNTNTTTGNIEKYNRKLEKLTKVCPHAQFLKTDQNRELFTKHGLQYNRLGKQQLLHQVALKVYSLFEQKNYLFS